MVAAAAAAAAASVFTSPSSFCDFFAFALAAAAGLDRRPRRTTTTKRVRAPRRVLAGPGSRRPDRRRRRGDGSRRRSRLFRRRRFRHRGRLRLLRFLETRGGRAAGRRGRRGGRLLRGGVSEPARVDSLKRKPPGRASRSRRERQNSPRRLRGAPPNGGAARGRRLRRVSLRSPLRSRRFFFSRPQRRSRGCARRRKKRRRRRSEEEARHSESVLGAREARLRARRDKTRRKSVGGENRRRGCRPRGDFARRRGPPVTAKHEETHVSYDDVTVYMALHRLRLATFFRDFDAEETNTNR